MSFTMPLKRMTLILLLIGFSLVIFTSCHASADSGFTEYDYRENGFSVVLPNYWVEIPKESIGQLNEANDGSMPFKCGFRLKEVEYDFDPPYILVYVNKEGKVSTEEWRNFRESNKQYTNESHIIWFTEQEDVEGIGTFECITAYRPTEKGSLQLTLTVPLGKFPEYQRDFQQIVNSIHLQRELEYIPDTSLPSYSSNAGHFLYKDVERILGFVTVFGTAFFVLYMLFVKKSQLKKKKEELEKTQIQKEYMLSSEESRKARESLIKALFIVVGLIVSPPILLCSLVTALNKSDFNLGLLIGYSSGTIILIVSLLVLTYFIALRISKTLYEPYTISLTENGIIVKVGNLVPYFSFRKEEICSLSETKTVLKITTSAHKRVTIPKEFDGYEDLKAVLQSWAQPGHEPVVLNNAVEPRGNIKAVQE